MKLCLIGDSHAAMLIAAHRLDPAGENLTVFAKPGLVAGDIALDGPRLRAASVDMHARLAEMGMPDTLNLADFDAVAIAGLVPSAFAAARLQQGHSVTGWPSGAHSIAKALTDAPAAKTRPLLSRAAYVASLTGLCQTSLAARIASIAPCPVVVIAQPFPSDALLDKDGTYPIFRRLLRHGDGSALAADLITAHRAGLTPLSGTTYLPQPADTLSHGCLTQAGFMRGGPRLSNGTRQDSNDVLHGNAALGARLLSDLRAILARPG
ncbi:hypothetical protein ANTHELSMS3_03642 [Antarctobacter heliothermus]|uniref:Uncharacterized protein n=1 Tax=Antarctobacter heliothermus TaxID=74033 RepID=A0A222E7U0_9RHOB|nr:hypothetical protein [Antarctobacter heliothermus]ASP22265.1 hypothetical protein ANTHELSMS3_03642 [Antarctobacter heliothermus]